MFLPRLSHIVMTNSHLRPLTTLGNKRYVNDHSHLKFFMKTPCQVTLMTHSTRHLSHPWKQK
ncbi:unnamed protein product, partial [Staurois parvus]